MILALLTLAFAKSPEEAQALDAYYADKLLTARRLSEEILAENPQSIYGNYVLGCSFRLAEGNLPKAMHHIGKARQIYEETQGVPGTDWKFHREMLDTVQMLANELEEYSYQLTILDYYDALYEPDMIGERAWPLMKLGRIDEAREAATAATKMTEYWQQSLGHNALCALESEAGNRQASYEACLGALQHEKMSDQPDLTVDAYNASLSAKTVLRFEEAERLAEEAIRGQGLTTANPWSLLMDLHLSAGEGTRAVQSIRDLQRWKKRLPPQLRDQNRAEQDADLARLLLVAGKEEKALAVINRALLFPDRRALTSSSAEQALGGHAVLRHAILDLYEERAREQASLWGLPTRTGRWLADWAPRTDTWEDQATITTVLAHRSRLERTFRPHVAGGLQGIPPWLVGDLIPILGTGVVSELLDTLRARESPPEPFAPYYDAYAAEVAWWSGRYRDTLRIGEMAISALPSQEALLRARTLARMADSARRVGDWDRALGYYAMALNTDAGILRRLGLRLPATVEVGTPDPVAKKVATLLGRSPRIRWTRSAFTISVEGQPDNLYVILRTRDSNAIATVRAPKPPPPQPAEGEDPAPPLTDAAYARYVADRFHTDGFAMPLGLTNTDLRSLDGSPVIASGLARENLESILEEVEN